MTDVILVFPGQGSQKPGMGKDLVQAFPEARAVFDAVDEAVGGGLSALCFDGPAEELTLTHNAQPALLAHGAAVWRVLQGRLGGLVRASAGHSLGEFTAHVAAGTFSFTDGARIVRRRGELMLEAGRTRPGTMAALMGEFAKPVDEICAEVSADPEGGLVVPANYNTAQQIVISGERAGVELAMERAKGAGVKRAVPLVVSGAFHSPLMAPARDGLREILHATPMSAPRFPVYANVTAAPVRDVDTTKALLVEQLTAPVRWIEVVQALVRDYPGATFVELGPGAVLAGLIRKIAPGATVLPAGSTADIEQILTTFA